MAGIIKRPIPGGSPLVVRLGALGDTVLITPLIEALALRFGRPVDVLGGPWVADLFQDDPRVGSCFSLRSRRTPYALSLEQQSLVEELRRRERGPVFLLDTLEKVEQLLFRAGVRNEDIIRRDMSHRRHGEHVVDISLRMLDAVGGASEGKEGGDSGARLERGTKLFVGEASRAACDVWLSSLGLDQRSFVLVQPGTSRTMKGKDPGEKKHWPLSRWICLIREIALGHPDLFVLVNGSPREAGFAEGLAAACRHRRVMSIAREMSISRLMALLKRAVLCVSVDTGPAHVAAAVGCPLVVLFGGVWPRTMAPLSRGSAVVVLSGPKGAPECESEEEWLETHNMVGIAIGDVIEGIEKTSVFG